VLDTGEPHQVEDELNMIRRRPDGGPEPAYFSWSLHRVRLPGNDGWGILNCAWETTARKQAEEAVRQSEERLRFALETSHTGAWDLDLVDHTAFRSLEHDRIFGYSELLPEWTYENFLEHILPEDRAAVDAKFQEATARQTDWSFECRIRRADGETRWIWAAGRHRADPASGRRRMAGIVQDITERKAAEASLGKPGDFVPAQGRAGPHARPE
jgi:PAS domain S-box-containing protein